ncbi:MarR family transcriptional regulator [Clostridium carnis]
MENKKCEHIGRYISQIQRKGNSFFGKELNSYGLGYGQFPFLMELYRGDGVRQEDLASKLHIDKGTTARAVKKLEDSGFIIRSIDDEDKRAYRIFLTDKGKSCKENIYKITRKWEKILTSPLTQDEKSTMISLLKKLCENEHIK